MKDILLDSDFMNELFSKAGKEKYSEFRQWLYSKDAYIVICKLWTKEIIKKNNGGGKKVPDQLKFLEEKISQQRINKIDEQSLELWLKKFKKKPRVAKLKNPPNKDFPLIGAICLSNRKMGITIDKNFKDTAKLGCNCVVVSCPLEVSFAENLPT
jgi:hypothetical protein